MTREILDLGDRMKEFENAAQTILPRRLPVILRLDGRAFHSFTRGMKRPFDDDFRRIMAETALDLCDKIGGAKFAFTQSDEISVVITNDDTLDTQPWFGNNVQKLVSLSAALATAIFTWKIDPELREKLPHFDARVFVVPPNDLVNYLIWRQQDATRNSINMLGQTYFSVKELDGLSTDEVQEKLWKERGVNWNDTPVMHKRGVCIVRRTRERSVEEMNAELDAKGVKFRVTEPVVRNEWSIDWEPPIFTKDRDYVGKSLEQVE